MLKVKINKEANSTPELFGVSEERANELSEIASDLLYQDIEFPSLVDKYVNADDLTDAEKCLSLMALSDIANLFYGGSID